MVSKAPTHVVKLFRSQIIQSDLVCLFFLAFLFVAFGERPKLVAASPYFSNGVAVFEHELAEPLSQELVGCRRKGFSQAFVNTDGFLAVRTLANFFECVVNLNFIVFDDDSQVSIRDFDIRAVRRRHERDGAARLPIEKERNRQKAVF